MRGPEHVYLAVAATGVGVYLLGHGQASLATYAGACSSAAFGALVPDIDHPQSLFGNGLPERLLVVGAGALPAVTAADWMIGREAKKSFSSILLTPILDTVRPMLPWAWAAVGVAVALLVLSLIASTLLEHRGPTHSLVAGALLTLLGCTVSAVAGQPWVLGLWFGWGYATHLLSDMLTPMRCPALLWPLGQRNGSAPGSHRRPVSQGVPFEARGDKTPRPVRLTGELPIPTSPPEEDRVSSAGSSDGEPTAL